MLKVPQKVDHALLLLRRLAEGRGKGKLLSLEDVSAEEAVSQGYLEEVARLLRSAGMIEGKRGAKGGYVLLRDPRDIAVADVVIAVERHTWVDACVGIEAKRIAATGTPARRGGKSARTPAHAALWRTVQGQVMTTLRGITIADLSTPTTTPVIASETQRSRKRTEIASSLSGTASLVPSSSQ